MNVRKRKGRERERERESESESESESEREGGREGGREGEKHQAITYACYIPIWSWTVDCSLRSSWRMPAVRPH